MWQSSKGLHEKKHLCRDLLMVVLCCVNFDITTGLCDDHPIQQCCFSPLAHLQICCDRWNAIKCFVEPLTYLEPIGPIFAGCLFMHDAFETFVSGQLTMMLCHHLPPAIRPRVSFGSCTPLLFFVHRALLSVVVGCSPSCSRLSIPSGSCQCLMKKERRRRHGWIPKVGRLGCSLGQWLMNRCD